MEKPYFRRSSLKGKAGEAIKCLYISGPDGTQIEENVTNIFNILKHFGEKMAVGHFLQKDQNIPMNLRENICTGMVCLFQTSDPEVRHFIPYIKIGNTWYNGDNEIGFLRKREGPPTAQSKLINDQGIEDSVSYLKSAILLYCDPQIITNPRTNDWSGRLIFGQLGLSCGPDALQTVLMFADGFYERFNLQLYNEMKQYIDPIFSYDGLIANPYSEGDLKNQKIRLSEILVKRRTNNSRSSINTVALEFLAYMFIRYYGIETSPPLEYTPDENSIRTIVSNNDRKAYLNALEYLKTHNENNNNWKKSSKFVDSFVKLYPDFIPPTYFLEEEFGKLMQKLYNDFAKTLEGNGRLRRVLFFIYYNLHLEHNGETVKTKKFKKYHEIFDKYAKEYAEEYNDAVTNFEGDEYKVVQEFYNFFKDNWKIIMENLSRFQEVYYTIRNSYQEREKHSNQRKTRKMRKLRNSKSRKL
jgi:hypothetical protein